MLLLRGGEKEGSGREGNRRNGEVTGGGGRDFGPSQCWKQIDAAALFALLCSSFDLHVAYPTVYEIVGLSYLVSSKYILKVSLSCIFNQKIPIILLTCSLPLSNFIIVFFPSVFIIFLCLCVSFFFLQFCSASG